MRVSERVSWKSSLSLAVGSCLARRETMASSRAEGLGLRVEGLEGWDVLEPAAALANCSAVKGLSRKASKAESSCSEGGEPLMPSKRVEVLDAARVERNAAVSA